MTLRFRLIGSFGVLRDGRLLADADVGSRKARLLLKLLVVERDRHVSTDRIVELLWGDGPPQRPVENVATLVSRLRAALGPEVIGGSRSAYRLGEPFAAAVDLVDAERLVREATARAAANEPALALAAAQRALELLGAGVILADEPYADWAEPARAQASELLRNARQRAAESALAIGDLTTARESAQAALTADALDEVACRALMIAHQEAGEPARALAAYARLAAALSQELGTDPAQPTRDLHLAILREQEPALGTRSPAATTAPSAPDPAFVGRDDEAARLAASWAAAVAGRPALLLITGPAGIGKTRLASEAARLAEAAGSRLLRARCYATERSLFLQPVVEALRGQLAVTSPEVLRDVAGEWAAPLAMLVPEARQLLGLPRRERGAPAAERRHAFDAVTAVLRGLAERAPVLLLLDDLQNAGLATVELLHYLVRHLRNSRVLVVGTVRIEESDEVLPRLHEVAEQLAVGPLGADAVARLAAAAGRPELADSIHHRTGGHPLFVVETLRGLLAGEPGIPGSLQAAVTARVRQAGPDADELLRAASVLGPPFEPATLAAILDISPVAAARRCELALRSQLIRVAGRAYEFANDLVQEVLYETTPAPTRVEYHRRAAEQLADQPEPVAVHALAGGDLQRAARAWLVAGENALSKGAVSDAERLLDRSLDLANTVGDLEIAGRTHLTRGRAREAMAAFDAALSDHQAAAQLARQAGDRRLELLALRQLGGDVLVALGRAVDCISYLEAGVRLAEALGDRVIEADLLARLAVFSSNRLGFERAHQLARKAVAAATVSGSELALAAALDGLKTAHTYTGDISALEPVLARLEPLLRRQGDWMRLQWTVFESALPALARGDWDAVVARIDEVAALQRRTGYQSFESYFLAHRGWVDRLRGRDDDAVAYGWRAVAAGEQSGHPWWIATANGFLAVTMLELGDGQAADPLLAAGLAAAERSGAEAYRLRCIAPLAEATGDAEALAEAEDLLAQIGATPGAAWLLGADAYLCVARARLARGEPAAAAAVLAPLLTAAERAGWVGPLATGSLVAARCAAALGDRQRAVELLTRAHDLAVRHGLAPTARAARELLAQNSSVSSAAARAAPPGRTGR